jgi:hypothetical protein
MKARRALTLRTLALVLAIAGLASSASIAHSAAKCPNRFFKRVRIKGVVDTLPNAQTAYDNDLAAKIANAKPDCDKLECEETGTETCTFLHTQSKKPDCQQQGPGFKCVGFMRPGCFCLEPDEEAK